MVEMILPGTYIEVRAEGLIRPGPISIGNVGMVGTARRGRLTTVYTPANIGEAREIFGQYDAADNPEETNNPLTLVRAMEIAYANGAQRVFAVRVAADGAVIASYTFPAATGTLSFTAVAPGTGYNDAQIASETGTGGLLNVTISIDNVLEAWRDVPAAVGEFAQVINGNHPDYDYRNKATTGGGSNLFTVNPAGATGNVAADQAATQTTDGTNGAAADSADHGEGLSALLNQNVHIVVLAGQGGSDMRSQLVSHIEDASTDLNKRERIGIIGSMGATDLTSPDQPEGRLVFAAPGVRVFDDVAGRLVSLAGTYSAAAVAGRISSLDPHASPTNKTINAIALETNFNGTELEQLLLGRVLPLEQRNGSIKIVRGITSSTNNAWSQITTRRIVDFAKFGVRDAADPFIGKLNNERVREALKGSINSFLADMVDREMLIEYELEVSATRDQQIRGIAQVTMILQPTFSIDYIRVVMYLQ